MAINTTTRAEQIEQLPQEWRRLIDDLIKIATSDQSIEPPNPDNVANLVDSKMTYMQSLRIASLCIHFVQMMQAQTDLSLEILFGKYERSLITDWQCELREAARLVENLRAEIIGDAS